MFPNCKDPEGWIEWFSLLSDFGINTDEQIAAFCATVGHESGDLNSTAENMNYSADRLMVVFPKYFRNVDVRSYHRNPEKIANLVYANRMGNGDVNSGDGWRYRGSGLIQLTGRNNFAASSEYLYSDETILLDDPDLVREDKEVSMLCSLWYWQENKLNQMSDFVRISRQVNGGDHGMQDRVNRYGRCLQALKQN